MKTIERRQEKQKQEIIEMLKRTPIVQIVCQKIGIGRASYYRWRDKDEKFKIASDKAIAEGLLFVSDVAESQLLTAIKDGNLTAIIFWLKNHNPVYNNKLEITGQLKNNNEKLTPEQEALVTKALKLAVMLPETKIKEERVGDHTSINGNGA